MKHIKKKHTPEEILSLVNGHLEKGEESKAKYLMTLTTGLGIKEKKDVVQGLRKYGDGVAVSGTNFPTGQENIIAVVMMTNTSWVVKATDRRNGIAVFFQRFEGTGEFVVRTGLGDLVIE